MKITVTKDNWDEVGKILRDFVESSDEIAICHHDYSEAYIGRVFDDPRRGVFTIMGTTVDDTRISVGLGDVLEVYEDTIWFHVSEEDEIRLTKRPHTEEEKRLCYTRRTPILFSIHDFVELNPKAKSLSLLLAFEIFEQIPVPSNDETLRLVKYEFEFDPSTNLHRVGLSLKDEIKLRLNVGLNYPKHPIKQFPCLFESIEYTLIKGEKTPRGVVYRDEFFTYNYGELIMEMTRCLK